MRYPFKREFNFEEEMHKIELRLNKAWEKYEENPTWLNAYMAKILDITEDFVNRLENLAKTKS